MDADQDVLQQVRAHGSLCGGEVREARADGVKALMLAVFEESMRSDGASQRRWREEARAWVASTARAAFSFTVVCEIIGIDCRGARRVGP
jgi:hypothetical protein